MRISDWSSDVCSSDLEQRLDAAFHKRGVAFDDALVALLGIGNAVGHVSECIETHQRLIVFLACGINQLARLVAKSRHFRSDCPTPFVGDGVTLLVAVNDEAGNCATQYGMDIFIRWERRRLGKGLFSYCYTLWVAY